MTNDEAFTCLLTDAQAGDVAAFDALVTRYTSPLFRYLWVQCDDVAVADTLTGELWGRVVHHLPAVRLPGASSEIAFRAWLYRIARDVVADSDQHQRSGEGSHAERLPTRTSGSGQLILVSEEHGQVWAVLGSLDVQQREVLLLRFVEAHSVAEVAYLTGRSPGAVQVIQYRALRMLVQWRYGSSPHAHD